MRQARQQRLAGHYDEAIQILSQVMLVASDDPRVIGEYGKTLAEKGRAQEAVQFLTRATELQPNDWSYYSALGVAYDQVGDQASARMAYEHALQLKPGEPSTLNNYALSRMLANDPAMARELIARAQAAGGASDPKIARNIALVNNLAPPAPKAAADAAPAEHAPVSAPLPVSSQSLPPAQNSSASAPANSQVVMQPVPSDPQAGPSKAAKHVPTPLATHVAKAPVLKPEIREAHSDAGKPAAKSEVAKADAKTTKADANSSKPQPADVKAAKADAKDVKAAVANPDSKAAPAKPAAKGGIPALRQTASVY